ncbi:MAG: hypothetical protein HYV60_16485 [Planctomycetia bacterium]|nr:hypothetical protein [Planctomycetia bacterium]
MIFVLDKRSIEKYVCDANLPQFANQDLRIINQMITPLGIPSGTFRRLGRSQNKHRFSQVSKIVKVKPAEIKWSRGGSAAESLWAGLATLKENTLQWGRD